MPQTGRPLVLFDGDCALCHRSVRFIARHDRRRHFLFSPLTSPAAEALLAQAPPEARRGSTVVLVETDGRVSTRSTAALNIAARLDRPWNLLAALRVIPRPVRDAIYDTVAQRRARWFGRAAFCDFEHDFEDRVVK
jgi:predicted DCC family thiol-disulfide oxidoreductase YuxK